MHMQLRALVDAPVVQYQPTPDVCNKIRCGFISQRLVPRETLIECSRTGYAGAWAGCLDERCRPYSEEGQCDNRPKITEALPRYATAPSADTLPFAFPPVQPVVDPRALTPPLPSITPARSITWPKNIQPPPSCGFAGWVDQHKGLAVVLVVAGYLTVRS